MEVNLKLSKGGGKLLENTTLCKRMIDKLLYLTLTTLDQSYSISKLSQFPNHPRLRHLKANQRIPQHIKYSSNRRLCSTTRF